MSNLTNNQLQINASEKFVFVIPKPVRKTAMEYSDSKTSYDVSPVQMQQRNPIQADIPR